MKGAHKLVGLAAGMYGAMVAIGLVWAWLGGLFGGWWTFTGPEQVVVAAGLGIGLGMLGVGLSAQMENSVAGVRQLGDRFSTILAGATTRDALMLAGLSAVGEEILFRGCLQEQWGFWPATIAFALVHSGPERVYLWWTASAFVYGIGLAVLYEHQGGLLGPILMHFVINAINIAVMGRRGAKMREHRRSATLVNN